MKVVYSPVFPVFAWLLTSGFCHAQSFTDNFTRGTDPGPLTPWIAQASTWTVSGGFCSTGPSPSGYAQAYITNVWTNISAQARVRLGAGGYGGGIGARVNSATGARYSAWIYPENSPGGSNVLKLIKFQNWSAFGYNGNSFVPMQQVSLPSVGTNWHTLRMEIQTNLITVSYDGATLISTNDMELQPLAAGGVSLEMWSDATPYVMSVDDVAVSTITSAPIAANDSYSATVGRTLTVPAPGVLANDSGGTGPLRAVLVAGVAHGTLSLSTNGGFTYNATAGYTGPDSFTYRASDGITNSPTATVSITVNANRAPVGVADSFGGVVNQPLAVSAPGVLLNDSDPDGDATTAALVSNATNGTVTLNANGSFTYIPNNNFTGTDRFTYRANDGLANSSTTTALLSVGTVGSLFFDNFARSTEPGSLSPWVNQFGVWQISGGELRAGTNPVSSYGIAYLPNSWANYVLEGQLRFQAGAFGGGISGRLNPATGARYAAWVYPEGSPGGSNVVKVIKFQSWTAFGYNGIPGAVMQQTSLPAVGTNFNRLKLAFNQNQIGVYWNGMLLMTVTDNESGPYNSGAIALDWWTDSVGMSTVYDNIGVSPIVTDDSYVLNMESTLAVASPGVLINDTGVNGTNLSAVLLANPTNGTLTLNANGGFSYTPTGSYYGLDSFSYRMSDNQGVLGTGYVALTINQVNHRPVLPSQITVTLAELASLSVTNTATDSDVPADNLTYSLLSPPAGATIDANGIISWVPTEAQGPSTNILRTRVTDDGSPPLSATNTFTVVVSELNLPPILPAQADLTIPERSILVVTNTASDPDVPSNPSVYTILTGPPGASVSSQGIITWTTTDSDGGTTNLFVVSVTDNGVPSYSDTNTFTVVVTDFNSSPVLPVQVNRTNPPLAVMTITNTAIDIDVPADSLTYSLNGPEGAAITPEGVITWTPLETDYGTTNLFQTIVTDNGQPPLSATNVFSVVVNSDPVLVLESSALILEQCIPANNLIDPGEAVAVQFSLKNVGSGNTTNLTVTLLETNGVTRADPAANLGILVANGSSVTQAFAFAATGYCGGTVIATLRFQDGSRDLGTATATFPIGAPGTILDQNFDTITIPALPTGWTSSSTGALVPWITQNTVRDTPTNAAFATNAADVGTSSLISPAFLVPAGPVQLSFRHNYNMEAGPSSNSPGYDGGVLEIKIGTNAFVDILAAGGNFVQGGYNRTISSAYLNILSNRPAWSGISSGFTNVTVSLPVSAAGQFVQLQWRCGTDNGGSVGAGWRVDSIAITGSVCCENTAPILATIDDKTVPEMSQIIITNTASDSSTPAFGLTYLLLEAPAGAVIDAVGIIAWTPSESQGPSTNRFTTVVTDSAEPPGRATNTFLVTVTEINAAPILPTQADIEVTELTTLVITNTATDSDLPAHGLAYALVNPPANAQIDLNGVITWAAPEVQVETTFFLETIVTDDGLPPLGATNRFAVVVRNLNTAPILPVQLDYAIVEHSELVVTNAALDDGPPEGLSYVLVNPPAGAVISGNGIITWTPSEAQGPGTNLFQTIVTDSGVPALSATNYFLVVVSETNSAPVLPVQTNQTTVVAATLTITNTATDADMPANALVYSLPSAPTGALIDTNGVITWTPSIAQANTTNLFETTVTDNGVPPLSATNAFSIVVPDISTFPVLPAQSDRTADELTTISITNTATHARPVNYLLLTGPAGMQIDTNGVIIWLPTEADGPSSSLVETAAIDPLNPQLAATNQFTLTIAELNATPVLPLQTNQLGSVAALLTVTNTATDADLPANTLIYTLPSAPAGALIDANGVITWTPSIAQANTTNLFETTVTDNGVPPLSATNAFSIVVPDISTFPVLPAQSDRTADELTTISITNTATHARPVNYLLLTGPAGMQIDTNGVIIWLPTEADGPSSSLVETAAIDPLNPQLAATNQFTLTIAEVNTSPVLPLQTDHIGSVAALLTVTNTATDADLPANTLIYSLQNAPSGAQIDTTGVITWTPNASQADSTNLMQTVVTDNGVPPLSATNSFLIIVPALPSTEPPVFQSIVVANGLATLTWTSVSNRNYRLEYKDEMDAASWTTITPDVPSAGSTTTATNSVEGAARRFYRVQLLP